MKNQLAKNQDQLFHDIEAKIIHLSPFYKIKLVPLIFTKEVKINIKKEKNKKTEKDLQFLYNLWEKNKNINHIEGQKIITEAIRS